MEIDLNLHQARSEPFRSQVCIIGAGIAGLTLAHRLGQQGIDVALLEAGSRALDGAGKDLFAQAQLRGEPHIGTTEGRFRAFGGSSLRWGGQLLPLSDESTSPTRLENLSSPPMSAQFHREAGTEGSAAPGAQPPAAWPISAQELAPFTSAAERLLGVDQLPYGSAAFFDQAHSAPPALLGQLPDLTASLSKWTPFARRNLADTLGRDILASPRVCLYLNAQVTELLLAPQRAYLGAVLARTLSGASFRFEADQYILAAGTVETSRLLLASRSVVPEGVGNGRDQVGRNFHDHLTVPAATLTGLARATLLSELRPWIFPRGVPNARAGATLHSAKLEASPQLRERLALNPILAHITMEEPRGSGLATLREILFAMQGGNLHKSLAIHAAHLPNAALEALRLAWSAKVHDRRYVSTRAAVTLRLNAAQDAPSLSRITLSDNIDPFGIPQPRVDWRISSNELATFRSFAAYLRERFAALHLDGFHWLPELFAPPDTPLPSAEDARHAMGGACMGLDPAFSVVDPECTVHGVANLSIASAATFPTGSAPLPALPLMALSLRLADRLISVLGK